MNGARKDKAQPELKPGWDVNIWKMSVHTPSATGFATQYVGELRTNDTKKAEVLSAFSAAGFQ